MTRTALSGWGRTRPVTPTSSRPTTKPTWPARWRPRPTSSRAVSVAATATRRSLGGGVVLSNRELGGVGPIDANGVVTVGAGVSLDELLAQSIPRGWFVPVTTGTRQVTIGGAVAADVHGKNHHVDGSFARHVLSMRLVTPTGALTVTPEVEAELFWATFGAMGLTGVVTSVTLGLVAIETDQVLVDTDRLANLDAVMDAMTTGDDDYRYSVAWVDCMSRGKHMGRAILTRGVHARRATSTRRRCRVRARRDSSCPSTRRADCSIRSASGPSTKCGSARRRATRSESRNRSRRSSTPSTASVTGIALRTKGIRAVPVLRTGPIGRDGRGGRRPVVVVQSGELPRGIEALRPRQPSPLSFPLEGGPWRSISRSAHRSCPTSWTDSTNS